MRRQSTNEPESGTDSAPGVLVEARVDGPILTDVAPSKPTPDLHPDLEGELEKVLQVQLKRFARGSVAVQRRQRDMPSCCR